ncbi:MAG: class I SAM-dependent methyltransferase [Ramlibacter sp.]
MAAVVYPGSGGYDFGSTNHDVAMTILRKILGQMVRRLASMPIGQRRYCCVCQEYVFKFLPYTPKGLIPYKPPQFIVEMDVIGSEIRSFSCPRCGSHDRERHLLLYLGATGLAEKIAGLRVLHLAPEPHVSKFILDKRPSIYVKGDLFPVHHDIQKIDLQAIPFPDRSFELVIANHVLEHVQDDKLALSEIKRVLAPEGYAILQTPYSNTLTGLFEDAGIATGPARLQAYGQEDHVRLYGRDIRQRFASAGFQDLSLDHKVALTSLDAWKYGVNSREPLLLFQKVDQDNLSSRDLHAK